MRTSTVLAVVLGSALVLLGSLALAIYHLTRHDDLFHVIVNIATMALMGWIITNIWGERHRSDTPQVRQHHHS